MIDSRYCTPSDIVIHGLYKECSTLSFSVVPSNGFETMANKDFAPRNEESTLIKDRPTPIHPNKINNPISLDRNRSGNRDRHRWNHRMKSENLNN